jgi:DNA-binding response OmpR family regulator
MSKGRILVVDDEPAFGNFVGRVGLELGFEVEVRRDADSFIAVFPGFDPDIVVLDVVMPEKDGIEVIRWLAEHGCRARIIVVTGYNPSYARMTELLGRALGNLTVSTLSKPVKLATLRAALLADPATPTG